MNRSSGKYAFYLRFRLIGKDRHRDAPFLESSQKIQDPVVIRSLIGRIRIIGSAVIRIYRIEHRGIGPYCAEHPFNEQFRPFSHKHFVFLSFDLWKPMKFQCSIAIIGNGRQCIEQCTIKIEYRSLDHNKPLLITDNWVYFTLFHSVMQL